MFFKKLKKQSVLQLTALFLVAVFAIVAGACPAEDEIAGTGTTTTTQGAVSKTPVVGDYNVSNNLNQTFGSVTAVTVTKKDNTKSPGAVTVYYTVESEDSYERVQTLPEGLGNYPVTFDVDAATGWNAASNLSAGTLVIGEPIPVATDFEIGNLNQLDNDIKEVSITPKTDKSSGDITIYYDGSETLPTTTGTYAVTFDVAEADGWQAATGLSAGNLIIGNASNSSPTEDDYNIGTNLSQTANSVSAVTVTKKDNTKSPGAVTVYYAGEDGTTYNKSSTVPQAVGKYAVTFDVAAASGWNAGSSLVAGTLIVKGTPIAADFDISSNLNQTAGGSITAVTVTAKAGKSNGTVTVYYTGTSGTSYSKNTTVPNEGGSYSVTFDVAATEIWNVGTGLSAGTLTISRIDPIAGDFNVSNLAQTAGSVTAVQITPKSGKSAGEISIKYNNSITIPQTVGEYTVTFDVTQTDVYNAATNLVVAEKLVVSAYVAPVKNYESGPDALGWGVSTIVPATYLGLTPGNTSAEVRLTWDSSGTQTKVRFVKGTFVAGTTLIQQDGTTNGSNHKALVQGLEPGSSYQYAVSSDGTNWSARYNFAVPAATGPFTFAVITDPQINGNVDSNSRFDKGTTTTVGWKKTMDILSAKGVSFIASCGDQVDTNNSTTQYTSLFAPDGMKSLPFSPVMGNHDNNTLFFTRFNIPNEMGTANNTSTGANYYYLYNNILFVVLNTAPYPGNRSAAQAYVDTISGNTNTTFEKTLIAAKAAHPNYDWLIVQHHKSTASVASHIADTDIQYFVEAGFETLMSKYKVDFVLAGHDHVYARSYPLAGKDAGKVSLPDKTKGGNTVNNPGNPIYITLTTASGLKYYDVPGDPYHVYSSNITTNNNYPYLDANAEGTPTLQGTTEYKKGRMPLSNLLYVQPWIASYTIVEVNGKTIKFSTYPIGTATGKDTGASQSYDFNANTPYDWVEVTKD